MQPRNNPLKSGRRRGHELANKNSPRAVIREIKELTPAKTRNPQQTQRDVQAQAKRLGIGQDRSRTQKRLNQAPPVSAYRQGKRNAKHKPEVHRSRRNELRIRR